MLSAIAIALAAVLADLLSGLAWRLAAGVFLAVVVVAALRSAWRLASRRHDGPAQPAAAAWQSSTALALLIAVFIAWGAWQAGQRQGAALQATAQARIETLQADLAQARAKAQAQAKAADSALGDARQALAAEQGRRRRAEQARATAVAQRDAVQRSVRRLAAVGEAAAGDAMAAADRARAAVPDCPASLAPGPGRMNRCVAPLLLP